MVTPREAKAVNNSSNFMVKGIDFIINLSDLRIKMYTGTVLYLFVCLLQVVFLLFVFRSRTVLIVVVVIDYCLGVVATITNNTSS
mmetsp:Transcript_49000/g.54574  ORF Transcript_49000/g.54574 Transcript_49000/m.54574 type:complete len:85 (-) Transcript_49000:18-272(-)